MESVNLDPLIASIQTNLLPALQLESIDPHNPIVAHHVPAPWQLLGTGNYAAVLYHPDFSNYVVKIYAPGRLGLEEELEVYRRLGNHPAFSECLYSTEDFLILKRLYGTTLYDCVNRGIYIPPQVIEDIDRALDYARQRGLFPHDVHGRNVMVHRGRGLVVDISDFLHQENCSKWQNLKRAYYWIYRPVIAPLHLRIPYFMLDGVRFTYRMVARLTSPWLERVNPRSTQIEQG